MKNGLEAASKAALKTGGASKAGSETGVASKAASKMEPALQAASAAEALAKAVSAAETALKAALAAEAALKAASTADSALVHTALMARIDALETALNARFETPAPTQAHKGPRIVDIKAAADLAGISEATVRRRLADGDFPAKIKLSTGRVGFVAAEVIAWVETRKVAA